MLLAVVRRLLVLALALLAHLVPALGEAGLDLRATVVLGHGEADSIGTPPPDTDLAPPPFAVFFPPATLPVRVSLGTSG
ncbi:hypothetical protein GCM10011428_53090 [Streptomyces violaceus]